MKKRYMILSACGTGIATSTVAANSCKTLLEERGLKNIEIIECKAAEILGKAEIMKPDCIIYTAEIPIAKLGGIKCFRAIQLITGIGTEQLADEMAEYLKTLND